MRVNKLSPLRRGLYATALLGICLFPSHAAAPASAPSGDALGRQDPRSAVTGFLETCRNRDYQKAAQYLDLRTLNPKNRDKQGPDLARKLEAILDSDTHFNVLRLPRNPEGAPSNPADTNRQPVATITQDGQNLTLELERVAPQAGGAAIWLFSDDTVAALPGIRAANVPPTFERFLPQFLVSHQFLATPLWKWLALSLLVGLLVSLSRMADAILALVLRFGQQRRNWPWKAQWLRTLIQPVRVMLWLTVLRIAVGLIDPSAIARLYIGRAMMVVLVWSIALCMIRLVDLFTSHLEMKGDEAHRLASRTMLRLGRRTASVIIAVCAILLVLQNWGYNTSTLIAGLGVGGIAVALAAQQTIANIFGGVSLVGDHPIRIGEFGKFGDMEGVVEDIGMRSTRVRTLNRTVVSVPNSTFAGLNLENYSIRDKILFNPKFQIKRSTTEEQVRTLLQALSTMLAGRRDLELAAVPARVVGLASGGLTLEIFCYVLTPDINEFYKIQGDLLLRINAVFSSSNIELA